MSGIGSELASKQRAAVNQTKRCYTEVLVFVFPFSVVVCEQAIQRESETDEKFREKLFLFCLKNNGYV